jgi:hypothetical protein
MVFANASARTSAIASPQEGMISYLKDTNSTEYYSGSAWVAIGGSSGALTLIGTTTLSSSGSFNLSNIFTSNYANYEIHITGLTGSTGSYLTYGLRTGSTNAATNYDYFYYQISTGGSVANGGGTGSLTGGNLDYGTAAGHMVLKVMNPYVAAPTALIGQYTAYNAQGIRSSRHTDSTSFDGMWFTLNSGTVSGKVSVYGYSN